jgi:GTP-binding protein HflX
VIHNVVITDTVGFIDDLPKDLMGAFRPTFDELRESDLLIHLIDVSHPRFREHIESVEKTLSELRLDHIARLRVFNKKDKLRPGEGEAICRKYGGVSISALQPESLEEFFLAVNSKLWEVDRTRNQERHPMDGMGGVRLTNEDSFDISNQNWVMEERGNDGKPSYRD